MKRAVWTWAGNAIALYAAVAFVGDASLAGWTSLLFAAAVFGVVNTIVKPVVKLLALPLIVLTVGIALFFINVLMLWITDAIVGGIHFDGFGRARRRQHRDLARQHGADVAARAVGRGQARLIRA